MSAKNGVWHVAELDPPGAADANTTLLVIRKVGHGKNAYCRYDFGIYNGDAAQIASGTGAWNKSGVVYWMPLPKMPAACDPDRVEE